MAVALLIAGMHRSGTSAVSRLVNLLGVSLPNDLMPEIEGVNERGFWESISVMDIHDRFLQAVGSEWADFEKIPTDAFIGDAGALAKSEINDFLDQHFNEVSMFSIKDPRICRLIPLWLPVLKARGIIPKFIIPFRNPIEVSKSLQVRDGIGPQAGFLLWLRHVLEAEKYSRGYHRSFVSYESILADWRQGMMVIAKDLSIQWPKGYEEVISDIDAFLSPELRHHHVPDNAFEYKAMPALICAVYELLNNFQESHELTSADIVDDALQGLDQACELFHGVPVAVSARYQKKIEDLETQLSNEKENARNQIEYRESLLYSQTNRIQKCESDKKILESRLISLQQNTFVGCFIVSVQLLFSNLKKLLLKQDKDS